MSDADCRFSEGEKKGLLTGELAAMAAAAQQRDVEAVTSSLLDNTMLDVYGIGSERGKRMNNYRVSFENAGGLPGVRRPYPSKARGFWSCGPAQPPARC